MASDIEARLRALEDREAIRELRATYCVLVDAERFDELVERCFTEDARCDFRGVKGGMPPLVSKGREAVLAFFRDVVGGLLRDMCHTVHNHRIVLEGDEASGDCTFELTAVARASGEALVGTGRYLDRYRKVDGSWRFAERRAEIAFLTALDDGWARRRFLAALEGGGEESPAT